MLSESTAAKDLFVKRELYESQRVEHYLIVDTAERSIRWLALQATGKYEDTSSCIADDGLFSVSLSDGCTIHFDRKAALA